MSQSGNIRKLNTLLKKVNSLSQKMASLNDSELQAMTDIFRKRLKEGETTDDILPEAFAVIREADKRILGMYPYDSQVLGAIGLKVCSVR